MKIAKIGCLGLAGVAILALVAVSEFSSPGGSPPSPSADIVPAAKMIAAFEANEAAAIADYGHSFNLTGTVDAVVVNLSNRPVLHIRGRDRSEYVTAHLNKTSEDSAASLRKGDRVAMLCEKATEIMGIPIVRNCVFQPPA